jgi:hypothetical protein
MVPAVVVMVFIMGGGVHAAGQVSKRLPQLISGSADVCVQMVLADNDNTFLSQTQAGARSHWRI